MMRSIGFALTLVLAVASSAIAADGRRMLGAHEQKDWMAVGRLNFGDGFCTAALVAPDLVATAAHCLYAPRTGAIRALGNIHFIAGYRLRKFAAHRKAARIDIHPEYSFALRVDSKAIATDLALVKLDSPIEDVAPLPLAPGLSAGDDVLILSYGRDRREIPSIQSPCDVEDRGKAIAILNCDATYGVSGAPVMRMIDGAPHIVAVVSAVRDGSDGAQALVVVLEAALPAVLAAP
ncbi:MAG: trypsin-like serine protease [Pseudomonadota bacterium]